MNIAFIVEAWGRACLLAHERIYPFPWLLRQARRALPRAVQPEDLLSRIRRSDGR
jgi:hypothetical protein